MGRIVESYKLKEEEKKIVEIEDEEERELKISEYLQAVLYKYNRKVEKNQANKSMGFMMPFLSITPSFDEIEKKIRKKLNKNLSEEDILKKSQKKLEKRLNEQAYIWFKGQNEFHSTESYKNMNEFILTKQQYDKQLQEVKDIYSCIINESDLLQYYNQTERFKTTFHGGFHLAETIICTLDIDMWKKYSQIINE